MTRSIISRDIGLKKIGGDSPLTSLLYSQTDMKKNIRSSIIVLFPSASRSLTRCFATTKIEAGKKAKFIPISPTVLRRDIAGVLEKRKS